MKVLVTGGSGFVGGAVVQRLSRDGQHMVRVAARDVGRAWPSGVEAIAVGALGAETDWRAAVAGVDCVIHCAARVHVMRESEAHPDLAFRRDNVDGSLRLATMAADAGCRRLIFLSSVKVNGEVSMLGQPFSELDAPAPMDAYGRSKRDAEVALFEVGAKRGLEVVVIRPPLVYGPAVKANFAAMVCWLRAGVPLPFGRVDNRRSLVALDNLVDLIMTCIHHPAAAGEVFLVSDGEDVSTRQLLEKTARALGTRAWLVPVPPGALRLLGRIFGKGDLIDRLCGNLQVDISKARSRLGWNPPLSMSQALAKLERTGGDKANHA